MGGTTLGLAGGALGSAAGVALALAIHPFLDDLVGRDVGSLLVNPVVLLAAVVMGTAAATLAALAPARTAAKIGVVESLAGITPPPRRPGRVAGAGSIVMIAGAGVTAWATIRAEDDVLAFGLMAMVVGVLLAIPLLVAAVGRIADGLPAGPRLAARATARHGRTTGAAVAAGVIALAVPVAVSAYSLSEEAYERTNPRLAESQLLIGAWTQSSAMSGGLTRAAAEAFEDAFPGASLVPLAQAMQPESPGAGQTPQYVEVVASGELGGEIVGGQAAAGETIVAWPLFVGDRDHLRALDGGAAVKSLEEGRAVVLGGYEPKDGTVTVRTPDGGKQKVPATAVESPAYFNESIPKVLVSKATARSLGLEQRVFHHLLANPIELSSEDVARARAVAARHEDVFVRSNDDYLPPYAAARAGVTAATIPLGLAILAVAVALVVSESRRSHQVLVAVGAGPLAHRQVVGTTAALLALITAVLAVPAGFLPAAVIQLASQSGRPVVVPWGTAAILVTLVPLLSALVAGLAARTPKVDSLLRPAT
jgi:putative ABC transport system permease protein